MTEKPAVRVAALDVKTITVSGDGLSTSEIIFQLGGDADLHVTFVPELLAKLEAMLAAASMAQAKLSPVQ